MTSTTRPTPSACWRSSSTRARASSGGSRCELGEIAVVLHGSPAQLDAAQPWLPVQRRLTAPVGAALRGRLGVRARAARALAAAARPARVERRGLAGDADAGAVVPARAARRWPPAIPASRRRSGRAGWRAGCGRRGSWRAPRSGSRARRGTCGRRSRDGCARASAPSFPPGRADALLLGGTVFDLVAREEGDRAAVAAARAGPDGALEAFGRRRLRHTEAAWRSHLDRLAAP